MRFLKNKVLLTVLILLLAHAAWSQQKITTFILLRHAEKVLDGTDDPELTPEGLTRAQKLAAMFDKTAVTAIYSTPKKRTRATVEPLAKLKHLEIQTYEGNKETDIEKMLKQHEGGTIIVAGHSDTTPWVANLLTATNNYAEFNETDFGNIFIISVLTKGKTTSTTWLRY